MNSITSESAKRWLRRASAVAALGYLFGLVLAVFLFRFVGERWWVTSVALYLPRLGFLLPLPFTVAALFAFGPRRLLPTQLLAALIVFFPLMGLVLPVPSLGSGGRETIRVLSFNVDALYFGRERVLETILAERADVVVLQEVANVDQSFEEGLRRAYRTVHLSTQFLLATRFDLVEAKDPDRIPFYGRNRSPRFMKYVLGTPGGRLVVYSVHPISPRWGLYSLRGQGLRKEILSGRLIAATRSGPMKEDTGLRIEQVRTFAAMAAHEADPTIVAGDTNLPGLSPALGNLADLSDGFREAGGGFGYTFPARRPWMRIDRIFASNDFGFSSFRVACRDTSDHLCVVADLSRKR